MNNPVVNSKLFLNWKIKLYLKSPVDAFQLRLTIKCREMGRGGVMKPHVAYLPLNRVKPIIEQETAFSECERMYLCLEISSLARSVNILAVVVAVQVSFFETTKIRGEIKPIYEV